MPKRLFLLCVLGNLLFASSQILDTHTPLQATNSLDLRTNSSPSIKQISNDKNVLNLALNSNSNANFDENSSTNLNLHSNLDENLSLNANSNATKIYNDDKKDFKNDLNTLKNTLLNAKIYENPKWLALLHYENGKSRVQKGSKFFLAKNGHKNAKDEYVATIERFFDELERHKIQNLKDKQGKQDEIQGTKDTGKQTKFQSANAKDTKQNAQTLNSKDNTNLENSTLCKYPARLYFIAQNLDDESFNALIDTGKCEGLNEFLQLVPLDELGLEFAAESEIYPGSAMGHIFLHLRGQTKQDFNATANGETLVRKKGDKQDYAMSYFAMMSEFFNPLDYVGALSGTLKGFYALNPYENAELDYLENEQRSIYIYKVLASKAQLRLFALHLWELKDKQISYNFITHNCTDGIESILALLDSGFAYKRPKPFITPTEYIRYLVNAGKIEFSELKTPPNKQKFVQKFGSNDILSTRKSSKISFGLAHLGGSARQGFLYFAPIYSDIKNANNAYKELIESRLASLELRFVGLDEVDKFKVFLHKIELLHLFSVADTLRTNSLSKLISLRFEPNLYAKGANKSFKGEQNERTRLFPTLDLALGVGAYAGAFSFYALGNLGYRYELIHNPFVSLKSGVVASFDGFKFIGEYQIYYDLNDNNRGYDSKVSLFAGLNAFKEFDIFAEFSAFHQLFNPRKIFYEKRQSVEFRLGASLNF